MRLWEKYFGAKPHINHISSNVLQSIFLIGESERFKYLDGKSKTEFLKGFGFLYAELQLISISKSNNWSKYKYGVVGVEVNKIIAFQIGPPDLPSTKEEEILTELGAELARVAFSASEMERYKCNSIFEFSEIIDNNSEEASLTINKVSAKRKEICVANMSFGDDRQHITEAAIEVVADVLLRKC